MHAESLLQTSSRHLHMSPFAAAHAGGCWRACRGASSVDSSPGCTDHVAAILCFYQATWPAAREAPLATPPRRTLFRTPRPSSCSMLSRYLLMGPSEQSEAFREPRKQDERTSRSAGTLPPPPRTPCSLSAGPTILPWWTPIAPLRPIHRCARTRKVAGAAVPAPPALANASCGAGLGCACLACLLLSWRLSWCVPCPCL